MKYDDIREEAFLANKQLPQTKLVDLTFGNVGVFDRVEGVFAIKPSGVEYSKLKPKDMVVVDLNGEVVDGCLKPSSDTPTYVEIFRAFGVKAVVHTHSKFATSFAQAKKSIPNFGTTHSDFFFGDIPVTRNLAKNEIEKDYEKNTGKVIVELFVDSNINPKQVEAVLVSHHAPFIWGSSGEKALENAIALELCARMAMQTLLINPSAERIPKALAEKHFLRKHGANAYYGQQ